MMYQDVMYVASATDDQYAPHLGVMMTSLFEHKSPQQHVTYYIIDGGISEENKAKLVRMEKVYKCPIYFLEVNTERYQNFVVNRHISHSAYYRISIPDLLPFSINKVIYLDCDLIIKGNIYELWNTELSDFFLGAVDDNNHRSRHKDLNIPSQYKYFNSGVMVINLEKWREHHISEKVLDFISKNPDRIRFWDQDGLNAVLYGKWLGLHPKWNLLRDFLEVSPEQLDFTQEDFDQALKDPHIIHYSNHSKPWDYMDDHPMKDEYYQYLCLTEWRNFFPVNKTIMNMSKKFIKRNKRFIPQKMYTLIEKGYHHVIKRDEPLEQKGLNHDDKRG